MVLEGNPEVGSPRTSGLHHPGNQSACVLSCPGEEAVPGEEPIKYGELIVLGYNGCLASGDKGRRRSRLALSRRPHANGVKPDVMHHISTPLVSKLSFCSMCHHPSSLEWPWAPGFRRWLFGRFSQWPAGGDSFPPTQALSNRGQHSISYTLSRSHSVIVEYTHDSDTDMFQIGRSTENMIDFVVTDTSPGGASTEGPSAQSTISRYACRILCDRRPPYTARIYAAGFDASSNIFLGERAAKWRTPDGLMDGLTTNGVLVMHPAGGFAEDSAPGVWREISVCGNVYTLRDSRSAQQRGKLVESESNVLQDGSLIDLCGATLLWRTPAGLLRAPTLKQLEAQRQEANAARPQCPVGLSTLAFPSPARGRTAPDKQQPWVYVRCGHVHGYHGWGCRRERGPQERECPLCRLVGPYVPLWLGQEAGLCLDPGPPSHAFAPCGHVCSEKTARYWAQTPLPHGTHAFHAACPFCGAWLTGELGCVRLIFQGPLD
ncbi:E3 ubiquitin-protein ligase pellino homolog 3 isoform X2 [Suncus etruscus]|uniref:E3 ubiquitin-protein ligase pellino homolog 3 isoform X2 n=1 Tax=Suncus etruscus TaxID=109475 RepID=UPI00211015B1|nr:E3 ubiquitin-protein ligase pellino homolog 3 isoform X2 [Suncus etruscus]